MKMRWQVLFSFTMITFVSAALHAQNVRITPLGQRTGEFCAQDRAILFEDPTGVRILYDPGNTVAGGTDPRLGAVHAILISHAHSDHLGGAKLNQDPDSTTASCSNAMTTPLANSNTAEIAAAKNSVIIAGGTLASVIGGLTANVTGQQRTPGCATAGLTNETVVPAMAPCTAGVGLGSKRTLRMGSATAGVQISAVTAEHPNELSSSFLQDPQKTLSATANELGAYVGLANGFVVIFTNGLRVYLSGDTGLTSDMSAIVNGYFGAQLAVINIGDIFTTGPEEAAFAARDLIHAVSVIPSHVNEAATQNGIANPGSKTARFQELLSQSSKPNDRRNTRTSVFLPLSGETMEFNGKGTCEAGCPNR